MTDLTPDLQFLVGEPLNAVHFVMDYVELHFNGSYLRCLMPPAVTVADKTTAFPLPGSRDALCARIGAAVHEIGGQVGRELRVAFSDGAILTASLVNTAHRDQEVLHFHDHLTGKTQWW